MSKRGFASDNNAGVHPAILKAMEEVNGGHAIAYGDDPVTIETTARMKAIFGQESEVFFVFIGTAANVLGLSAVTQSHHAVICPDTAHINVDECGAPEKFTGCKLLPDQNLLHIWEHLLLLWIVLQDRQQSTPRNFRRIVQLCHFA